MLIGQRFERVLEALLVLFLAAIVTVTVASIVQTSKLPPCIKSHVQFIPMPMMVGKIVVMQNMVMVVCDQRAAVRN